MSDDTYNGWSNWETWNVNLWLANDEPLYRQVNRKAREYTTTDVDEQAGTEQTQHDTEGLAEWMEGFVTQAFHFRGMPFPEASRFGDIDSEQELARVNWREIAETWMEE